MAERKQGIVSGFNGCSDEYLRLINEDLELGLYLEDLKKLRYAHSLLIRQPSVDELYFYAGFIRRVTGKRDNITINSVGSDNQSALKLWSEFVEATKDYPIRQESGISLLGAAYAAASTPDFESDYNFEITSSEKPVFTSLNDVANTISSNGYTIRYSQNNNNFKSPNCKSGILILPPVGIDISYFFKYSTRLVSYLKSKIRELYVFPCTEKGLFEDIRENIGPCNIYNANLFGHENHLDSCTDDFSPGFVIMVPRADEEFVLDYASRNGFIANKELDVTNFKDAYSVYSSDGYATIYESTLKLITSPSVINAKIGETRLKANPASEIVADEDDDVSVTIPGGSLYESLCENLTRRGTYCLCGTLNPQSDETLAAILELYAFVKNNNPKIAKTFFKTGSETSFTLFSFGKLGHNINLSRPKQNGITDVLFNPKPENKINTDLFNKESDNKDMRVFNNLSELCGNTPLLRLFPNAPAEVYAKLEMFNPAGSAKDRVAIQIIKDAKESGILADGGTIIEATSGNTGIGLACYGVAMGYRVIIVMPDTMSAERISLIKAYGAEIVLTDGSLGMKGSTDEAERIRDSIPGSIIAGQFENPSNPRAHMLSTGPEIWNDTDGRVDFFVAGVGTGGTLSGTAEYLKRMKPGLKAIGCEPASSPLITKGEAGPHKIQGIGANFIPKNFNKAIIDGMFTVTNEEAINMTKEIQRTTGLLVGISSGCAAFAAKKLAYMPENAGKVIVVLLPDTGEHYLSTGIFN